MASAALIRATALLAWTALAHLVGDTLCQPAWVWRGKRRPYSLAALFHAGLHALLAGGVYRALGAGPAALHAGLLVGALHWIIDTRDPLDFWQALTGAVAEEGPMSLVFAIGSDQALHLLVLAAAALAWGTR